MTTKVWTMSSGVCLLMLVGALPSGCASTAREVGHARAPADCGAPDKGIGEVLEPGALVLLGELHGTAEVPQFVGRLACQASSRGLRVRVGLEIPEKEQAQIDAFLSSTAPEDAKKALLASSFWIREKQDGRTSEAMLALLRRLGDLRRSGANIVVFAFDGGGEDREAVMARNIVAAIERTPADISLVLTGNLHAKITRGVLWDADFVPMGLRLLQANQSVIALNNSYSGGSTWACMGQGTAACKVHPVNGKDRGSQAFVELFATPEDGYHGIFHVGPITPSLPARGAAPQPAADGPRQTGPLNRDRRSLTRGTPARIRRIARRRGQERSGQGSSTVSGSASHTLRTPSRSLSTKVEKLRADSCRSARFRRARPQVFHFCCAQARVSACGPSESPPLSSGSSESGRARRRGAELAARPG